MKRIPRLLPSIGLSTIQVSPSILISSCPPHFLSTPRGGTQDIDPSAFDLDRASIRLESIDSYAVVAALLLSAALRLYASTPRELEAGQRRENSAKVAFMISAGLSIICGAYSCVVYSMLGLYAKTALGLGLDSAFLNFFERTTPVRHGAFLAFVTALSSFEVCFIISIVLNYDGRVRICAASLGILIAIISLFHWKRIINLAGSLLLG
jgi:hypothetical protein